MSATHVCAPSARLRHSRKPDGSAFFSPTFEHLLPEATPWALPLEAAADDDLGGEFNRFHSVRFPLFVQRKVPTDVVRIRPTLRHVAPSTGADTAEPCDGDATPDVAVSDFGSETGSTPVSAAAATEITRNTLDIGTVKGTHRQPSCCEYSKFGMGRACGGGSWPTGNVHLGWKLKHCVNARHATYDCYAG